ncbi:MAG: tRNA lysidine(34) synthetase TilS [Bacteroidia bacterium]
MLQQMFSFINDKNLFSKKDKLLLAVSGGADSVVMTELISQAGYHFAIAHCNFKLRGKDADSDEDFVRKWAAKNKVDFFSTSFETEKYALENKLSIQMAARELRYKWLEETRNKNNYNFICTAHHLNDSIETVLINLTKGTGISGLTGIKNKNNKIVRPLLFTTREEIENYARENKIKFRTDLSNLSDDYVRNKIRLNVIPLLKEINPSLEKTFENNMLHLQDIEQMSNEYFKIIIDKILVKESDEHVIKINELKKYSASGTILYYMLREYNFSPQLSSQIFHNLNSQSGKIYISSTHQLIKHGNNILIKLLDEEQTNEIIEIEENRENISVDNRLITISKLNLKKLADKRKLDVILKNNNYAALDEKKLRFPLQLRSWKPGDYFIPFGMKGKKKKLSDFLTDQKISVDKKNKIHVITSNKEIVWIVGKRVDERFAVTEDTINVLLMQLTDK